MILKSYERIDDLQCNGYKIIQDLRGFCFGIDAVLLANFARVKPGDKVADLGTGSGVIPILLAAKTQASHIYGVEIQEESAETARRSVDMNELADKITILNSDIKELDLPKCSFGTVTSNPPYIKSGSGLVNPYSPKAIARHETHTPLECFIKTAADLLISKGRFYLVHKPGRLAEIFALLQKYKLEPKTLQFVHGSPAKPPSLLLLEALKDGNPDLKVLEPVILSEQ